MRRLALLAGGALALIVVVGFAALAWIVRGSLPRGGGTATLPGLSAPATTIRDRAGVPHVFAASAADAQRALGFAQAQDRRLGLELARRDLALMSDANRALLSAWADGVNAATESGAAGGMVRLLGVPIEPWTPLDSVAAYRLTAVSFAFGGWDEVLAATLLREVGERDLDDFLPPYPDDRAPPLVDGPGRTVRLPEQPGRLLALPAASPAAFPSLSAGAGSNNWVVARRRAG